jgi:hypothetical protein
MPRGGARRVSAVVLACLLVVTGAAVALGQGSRGAVDYKAASGAKYTSVRPTGVGLPQIGVRGSAGAGELSSPLRQYHDSGAYDVDLATVARAAKAYVARRLDLNATKARRVNRCTVRYRKTRFRSHGKPLYRRVKRCKRRLVRPRRLSGKPAIVLDIDETSLSNYAGLSGSNFSANGSVGSAVLGTGTAIGPVLELYRTVRARGVAVFFVTGRPPQIQGSTEGNLRNVGYDKGWNGMYLKPFDQGTQAYKAATRAAIEQRGYDIVANVGDQESDLDGAHADRSFKLPNPFYFISD